MTNNSARLFEKRGEPVPNDVNCTACSILSFSRLFAGIFIIFLAPSVRTKRALYYCTLFTMSFHCYKVEGPPPKNAELLVVYCPCFKSPLAVKHGKGAIYLPKVCYLNGLNQGSVNVFRKGPESKQLWL